MKSLINSTTSDSKVQFSKYIACVHSEASQQRLSSLLPKHLKSGELTISRNDNTGAVTDSDIIILGVDPSAVEATLRESGIVDALKGKLLISVAAGWTREKLEELVSANSANEEDRTWVLRTLPNVCAQVSQSMTAIEDPAEGFPTHYMTTASAIFSCIGRIVNIPPRLMDATTAVSGSTPAFWAVICDAFIDAAVAVGLPRNIAQAQIYQSMRGAVDMLQSGVQPGELRDMGTSPEGCTIGGLMVLEGEGVRGGLQRGLREAVTVARGMGRVEHGNDTRR